MRGELSRTTKLFQIEVRLVLISYDWKQIHTLTLSNNYKFSIFLLAKTIRYELGDYWTVRTVKA